MAFTKRFIVHALFQWFDPSWCYPNGRYSHFLNINIFCSFSFSCCFVQYALSLWFFLQCFIIRLASKVVVFFRIYKHILFFIILKNIVFRSFWGSISDSIRDLLLFSHKFGYWFETLSQLNVEMLAISGRNANIGKKKYYTTGNNFVRKE